MTWRLKLAWLGLVVVTVAAAWNASSDIPGDVALYNEYARLAREGQWVGWHFPSPYPPGVGIVTWPMSLRSSPLLGQTWVFFVTLPITLLGLALLAFTKPAHPHQRLAAGALLTATTVALYDWWLRYDPAVTLAALAGLLAVRSARPLLAGVAFAVGFWLKAWPLALVLPGWRAAGTRVPLGAVAGVMTVWAAALISGPQAWSWLGFNGDRPPQPEAIASLPALLARSGGATAWTVRFDLDLFAYVVEGPYVGTLARIVTLLGLAVLAVTTLLYLKGTWHREQTWLPADAAMATVIVGVLIVTSPVYSPQYMAWLAAPLAVALLDGHQRMSAFAFVVACGLTSLVHPIYYTALVDGNVGPLLFLIIRDLLVLGIVAAGVATIVRTNRRSSVDRQSSRMGLEAEPSR